MPHCLHENLWTTKQCNWEYSTLWHNFTSRDHFATSSWRVILWGDQGESIKRIWSVIETDTENWADLRFSKDAELKDSHSVIDDVKELKCQE